MRILSTKKNFLKILEEKHRFLKMGNRPVVGENIEDAKNEGIEEWTFSLPKLHWSFFGSG